MDTGRIKKLEEEAVVVVKETITVLEYESKTIINKRPVQKVKRFWKGLGPGLTTGAADDDPSGITTYSQTGARTGINLLWLASLTFPMMAIIQEMCARIGLVTGAGLASNIKTHFSKKVLYLCAFLLFAANAFNIGADLGAMASVTELVIPAFPFPLLVAFFALLSLLLQIFIPYKVYSKYLKWLTFVLLAYILTVVFIKVDWLAVASASIIPRFSFSKDSLILITAILGTTISPYLFFWQTSQEVEEEILQGKLDLQSRIGATKKEIKSMRIDVWSGMFFSNLVMFFIIIVCAATLNAQGIFTIDTTAQAAAALQPLAGNAAYLLFAIGVIGTGLLAVPVLAGSASYAISESFAWQEGLYKKLHEAYAFYGVIIIAVLVGLGLNFVHINPIQALLYSAVANGIISPVVLVIIVLLASNKKVMGEWVNKRSTTIIGWVISVIMIVASIATIVSLFI